MQRRTILLLAILGLILVHGLRHHKAIAVKEFDWYNEQPLIDLHIPDVAVSHQTSLHLPVADTHVSMVPPDGYDLLVGMNGYHSADTSIAVTEEAQHSYYDRKAEIDQYMAYVAKDKGDDLQVSYRKDFRFNGYPASVICMSDTTRTHTAIYMIFGDEHFCVAMTGTTLGDSTAKREAIIQTMLTAAYSRA